MLEVKGIDTYYGNIQALRDVSLRVDDGEIVTLIGANGAGKSTTLMTICGINRPRKGEILWNGEPPYDESGEGDSEFVGSYEDGVFELTGSGNLSIGPFYEYQGKYYGFGSLLTPDGTTADVLLMR